MKTIILFLSFTFFVITNSHAQAINGLELHFKCKNTKFELYKELWLEAYLINKSKTPVKIFKIGFSEPGWDGFDEKWEGTLNGNPMKFSFFRDAPSGRFSVNSIVEVLPGDSIYAGILRYDMSAAGNYRIVYTLSADPVKVRMGYATNPEAADKARNISKFSVTSKPFEFVVEDIKMGAVETRDVSEEELAKKPMVYNIESAFSNPSDVFKFTVSGNITKDVLMKVCALKNLKVLYFDGVTGIDVLPDELSKLNLVELSFRRLDKIAFPASLSKLKNLKKISLEYLQITDIPEVILKLDNLEVISIRNCPIISVPNGIVNLKHLKELELFSVKIAALNPVISKISSLEKLVVSNSLTSFPAIFGCSNLKYLDLSYNKGITSIPAEIGQLKQLTYIHMAITGITAIPKELSNLKNLKVLEMSNNAIVEIPGELYECTSLEKIDLSYNKISNCAPGIDKLVNLVELSAYRNNISKLPTGLSKCPKIETVWVHTNNIKGNDEEGKVLAKKLGKKYCYKK